MLEKLTSLMLRHAPADGMHDCALPGVTLIRSSTPTMPMPAVYEPSICVMAQGSKQVLAGEQILNYDSARYLIAAVDVPAVGAVTEATVERPYLCVYYRFNRPELTKLALKVDAAARQDGISGPVRGLAVHDTTPQLVDAFTRLVELLDTPADIDTLAPLIEQEIIYRLATGPARAVMHHIATGDRSLNQVSRAIGWIKDHYREPITIDILAEQAGMSPSSLHAHFKSITHLSPIQYRARLRLQEARRLMVAEGMDAAQAAFKVGYDSASQFSREYGRLYGEAPATDASRLRGRAAIL